MPIAGHRGYWVCCRLDSKTRSGETGGRELLRTRRRSTRSRAAPIGAVIPAVALGARDRGESSASSDGTPGQIFELRYYPILETTPEEYLEVLDPDTGDWERWEQIESFVESKPTPTATTSSTCAPARSSSGPAIRTPDGSWRQYGARAEEGRDAALHPLPPRRRPAGQRRRRAR